MHFWSQRRCVSRRSAARERRSSTENHLKGASPRDGKQWLAWQSVNREDFVLAYINGYLLGVQDACALPDLEPDIRPKQAGDCRKGAPRYSNFMRDSVGNADVSSYTCVLTKFYAEHPEYQNIPYEYLMRYLTDEKLKTADGL
jgi:hypothetical protein